MNQKRNKIIVLISVLVLIIFVVWLIKVYKFQTSNKITRPLEDYYKECRAYLIEPHTSKNGLIVFPPQVFCKVVNGKVILLDEENIEIHPGDFVITMVDTPRLFTQKYFNLRNLNLSPNQKITLPQDKVKFCVSYGPYEEKSPLNLLPNIFQKPQILNKTVIACQEFPLNFLSPISVMGFIPKDSQEQPFGISILLPNKDNISYTTLYSGFVKIK